MPDIDPSAHVSPAAELAEDVVVGAGAVIEAGAVVGKGCKIGYHAVITSAVELGENNHVGHGCILGADPQHLTFDPGIPTALRIGDGNTLREYATIHRSAFEGKATMVGNRNFLMTGAHLGHDCQVGDDNAIANNVLLAGHVELGNHNFIGGGSVAHQFTRIADYVMAQGISGMGMDVPPYVIVYKVNRIAALNVIGLRRAGFDRKTRDEIRKAFDLFYKGGLNKSQALEEADKLTWGPEAAAFFDFIRQAGKRGICPYRAENK